MGLTSSMWCSLYTQRWKDQDREGLEWSRQAAHPEHPQKRRESSGEPAGATDNRGPCRPGRVWLLPDRWCLQSGDRGKCVIVQVAGNMFLRVTVQGV